MFYDNIAHIPVLTKQENRELARKAQAGDKKAKDKLITHNLRIVLKAIKKYKGLMEDDDLFSEGVIGLIKAIKPYNPDGEEEFSTYAYLSIKWYVIRAIDNKSRLIRIPVNACDTVRKTKDTDKYPQAVLNFNKPIQENATNSFGDLMEDIQAENDFAEAEHRIMQKELHNDLQPLFSHCHPTTVQYLLRFYNGVQCKQISKERGTSAQNINRICHEGIKTLRKYADKSLKEYIV